MAEDMSHSEKPLTECYEKLGEYWVYKEVLWFAVFILSGAYPAIAGNIIFIFFPVWRKIYKAERVKRELAKVSAASDAMTAPASEAVSAAAAA
jgi:Na+/H+ antiporter NhaA